MSVKAKRLDVSRAVLNPVSGNYTGKYAGNYTAHYAAHFTAHDAGNYLA